MLHSETRAKPRGSWLKFHSWPPKQHQDVSLFLDSRQNLNKSPSEVNGEDFTEQIYDPEFPTPHLGGPNFDWLNSGRIEQSPLEIRDDVSVFTSAALQEDLLVIGNVYLKLYFWSSNPHTDVFVKLCDVDGKTKKSMNIMEKMTRLSPDKTSWDVQGYTELDIDLGPIAVLFKKGNFVRIQVSGGAHPAYLRHSGTHDITSVKLEKARRRIMHSREYHSRLVLPIIKSESGDYV